ncbi:hypothetical protein QFC20_005195 [Naganishia adeliensis]|uniref:Uncharacterized protein n=1 Tax=Naganishia adeliensis TaxID=92952 RepID=A0ACC2VQQ2_9TREE|nr:hypothetical protein QFC20_005195 [Naganishia adeliensis]
MSDDDSVQQRKRPYPGPEKTRDSLLSKLAIKPWLESAPKGVVFTNARVVDPANSTLLDGLQTIVIRDGKIHAVESVQSKAISADNRVATLPQVDLDGAYICPGLIDCHVHVTAVPGVKTMSEAVRTPEEVIHYRSSYVLRGGATKPLALAISEGLILGPRLIQCGKAISQTGGHGDFSPGISGGSGTGCCGGHSASLARVADGAPQVLKATREELKAGADSFTVIKIMVGGGVASETDAIETVQYSAEEIQAITSTCKQMGNRHTTAHAYTVEAIRHAIDNGVKGIEHGNLLDVETAK